MIEPTTAGLIKEIGTLSYVGIGFVAFLSNVFIPVPEEVVLLILGYLAGGPKLDGLIMFPVVLLGLLMSDLAMYFFSKRGNKLVSLFYDKVFSKRIESKKVWIKKNLNKVVFFSRFLIQLRFLGPFFAGQTKMPFRKFFFVDMAALLIYTPIYLLLGFYFRNRIDFIINGVSEIKNIFILIILISALAALIRYIRNAMLRIRTEEDISIGE